jgi:cobalamin biosynthesis Mg chelatase CobN
MLSVTDEGELYVQWLFVVSFRDLFSTVIDMLATLIHSTLVSDSQNEKGEENRKHYQNLMKKLKKVRSIAKDFNQFRIFRSF